ncbi:hypothetical protein ACLBWH_15370 [Sphingomonas sp. M6A6_1c]
MTAMQSGFQRGLDEQEILDDLAYHLARSIQEDGSSELAGSFPAATCHATLGAMHRAEASDLMRSLDGLR